MQGIWFSRISITRQKIYQFICGFRENDPYNLAQLKSGLPVPDHEKDRLQQSEKVVYETLMPLPTNSLLI